MLGKNSPSRLYRALNLELLGLAAGITLISGVIAFPVCVRAQNITLEIPAYGSVSAEGYDELIARAEALARNAILEQFAREPERRSVKVIVTARRNSEVVPILSASVTRAQWQENPAIGVWSHYFPAYALLQRQNPSPAAGGAAPAASPVAVPPQNMAAAIDRAWDEGRLTGAQAQKYLSALD